VNDRPPALVRLLSAQEPAEGERAWRAFLDEHSRLIHLAARKAARDYDGVMDRYAYVLERLREDDYRRLRAFEPGGRSKFTTWLVVVASRLCVDWHRNRYGRRGSEEGPQGRVRRNLVDLVGEEFRFGELPDADAPAPDEVVRRTELLDTLDAALQELSPEDRLLLKLRYEDGRTAAQTARILGLSSEFAAHRRQRAILSRLREALALRGVHGPRP
jgi:RNA polymerase sigma factor (sigma-70 family)